MYTECKKEKFVPKKRWISAYAWLPKICMNAGEWKMVWFENYEYTIVKGVKENRTIKKGWRI